MDLSIFATPEAWISLVTLIFLEMILGVDNLVFIAITTSRLPEDKQHIGRRLGLAGALVMRIIFLSLASFLIHMTTPLFTIDLGSLQHDVSVRDLVLLAGGVYLIYKGFIEVRDVLRLTEVKAEHSAEHKKLHQIALPQAVVTIMIMDLVFSIDSVITAVGLADHLIIMIIAVMIAVFVMMVFIDPISNFINRHVEMKILALTFIIAIGFLLVLDSLGIHTGLLLLGMAVEKTTVYFAMIFAIILELIQMAYNKNFNTWRTKVWEQDTRTQVEKVRVEMEQLLEAERAAGEMAADGEEQAVRNGDQKAPNITPVFIGSNVYIMMPVEGQNASSFKALMDQSMDTAENEQIFAKPIEVVVENINDEAGEVSQQKTPLEEEEPIVEMDILTDDSTKE